jgi:hypothetical protein
MVVLSNFLRVFSFFVALSYCVASNLSLIYPDLQSTKIGPFTIRWRTEDPYIQILSGEEIPRVIFQTLLYWPFITVGYATSNGIPIIDGNYNAKEWTLYETPHQSITSVDVSPTFKEITFIGNVWGLVTQGYYTLSFFLDETEAHLKFDLSVDVIQGTFNRVFLNYWCDPRESFHGFGTQYTLWNLKGRRVPILVAEQGIGRGLQPLTAMLNFFGNGAGGDWSTTYAPKPLYLTNFNNSLLLENSEVIYHPLIVLLSCYGYFFLCSDNLL